MRTRNLSSIVAKERLLAMVESEAIDASPEVMDCLKREISEIIGRYFDISSDTYEIKVVLKENRNSK